MLQSLGLVDQPIDFIRADVALYARLSYAYVLLMVFPLYNAIESLDHNQIEAARDLGPPWWRSAAVVAKAARSSDPLYAQRFGVSERQEVRWGRNGGVSRVR